MVLFFLGLALIHSRVCVRARVRHRRVALYDENLAGAADAWLSMVVDISDSVEQPLSPENNTTIIVDLEPLLGLEPLLVNCS